MRTIRYREIAEELRRLITGGDFAAGRVLPSEAELSTTYSVSRVTIRKALELLRQESLVDSRQGFGWFVAVDPVSQTLVRLGTIESQLAASGAVAVRQVLDFDFVPAPDQVIEVLGAGQVLQVRRVNLANGIPFARVTVWCPERLGTHLSKADVERTSFYDLIGVRLGSAIQTIGAALASQQDAAVLGVPVGSPVLVCDRVTQDEHGTAVLVSQHLFPAHLTEFVVELPHLADSMSPTGLRLLDGND